MKTYIKTTIKVLIITAIAGIIALLILEIKSYQKKVINTFDSQQIQINLLKRFLSEQNPDAAEAFDKKIQQEISDAKAKATTK